MVLAQGLEMPRCCAECVIEKYDEDDEGNTYNYCCPLTLVKTTLFRKYGRGYRCPLIEVCDTDTATLIPINVLIKYDKPVYLEFVGCGVRVLHKVSVKEVTGFAMLFDDGDAHPVSLYGKQWRCWYTKPSIEQCMYTEWGQL